MSDPKLTSDVRNTWMGYWEKVDTSLAEDLRGQLDEKMKMTAKAFAPAGSAATGGLAAK